MAAPKFKIRRTDEHGVRYLGRLSVTGPYEWVPAPFAYIFDSEEEAIELATIHDLENEDDERWDIVHH